MITIYHNPRCRKSRETLQLLRDNGIAPTVIEYLSQPLKFEELGSLIKKLGIKPLDLIRRQEPEFKQNFKDKELSDDEMIKAILEYPRIMERPVVVNGDRAVIGRPPENVLQIL